MGGRQGRREGGRKSRYKFPGKKKLGSRMIGTKKKARKNKGTGKKNERGEKAQHIYFLNNLKI
jgi:hypothetical protein